MKIRNSLIVIPILLLLAGQALAAPPPEDKDEHTSLGLYVTAKEAFAMWHVKPEEVNILDVRTPQEYQLVGHAPMARNIPFAMLTDEWNPEKKRFAFKPNPDFMKHVKATYKPDDTLLVMCRSGSRAAKAVNAMAKAGFTKAYLIVDSFEGDKVTAKGSYYIGKRMKNGWKNSGAPWGYDMDPKLVYRPKAEKN